MRNLSPAVLAKIAETQGTEPINIVRIFWTTLGGIDYADADFDNIKGKLITLSDLEDVIDLQGNSTSTSISVTLDDSDGSLKEIFNNTDIHRRPVQILQWFTDLPYNEAFVIFEGQIASPVQWQEGDRTLSFNVLSKLEDNEVGYSAEEGAFEWVPQELVGRAWPLVFGTAIGIPVIQVNKNPRGVSGEDIGITDLQTNTKQIAQNKIIMVDLANLFQQAFYTAGLCYVTADSIAFDQQRANSDGLDVDYSGDIAYWEGQGDSYIQRANQYLAELTKIKNETKKLEAQVLQDSLKKDSLNVIGSSLFPLNTFAQVQIGDLIYGGYFDETRFNVTQQPKIFDDNYVPVGITTVTERNVITEYSTQLPPARFSFQPGGSLVQIDVNYPLTYIVCLDHLSVLYATSHFSNIQTSVPRSYYNVVYRTFSNGLKATFIQIPTPLSSIDKNWNDEIFVTVQNPASNNPVDIIKSLITNYTSYGFDDTSFNIVHAQVAKYPMNFAILDKKNVMQVLKDIAYQARCAIWFNDRKFFLKMLAAEDTSVETITDDDVDAASIQIAYTGTEDVITKYIAEWKADLSQNVNKIIFRNNIDKYGVVPDTYNYYCYNVQAAVEKMAEFWLIRRSNVFKRITFRTFLTKLRIETWDTITLNFAEPLIANGPIKALVESAKYDTATSKLIISCWVPVRAGEMTQYPFAWPAGLPIEYIYPFVDNTPTTDNKIVDQTTIVGAGTVQVTRPHSDLGRHRPIGDAHDVFDDYQVHVRLSDPDVGSVTRPNFSPTTYKNYQLKPNDKLANTVEEQNNQHFYGLVQEKIEAKKYKVQAYTKGLDQDTKIIIATQFTLRDDETIPQGTPCLVTLHNYLHTEYDAFNRKTQRITREYVMQVPTWVKAQPTPTP